MIYPQRDPKEVPLSKQMGYYRGPGYDEAAEQEIASLRQQVEALRVRTGALLTLAFIVLGVLGVWLSAITYRMLFHR